MQVDTDEGKAFTGRPRLLSPARISNTEGGAMDVRDAFVMLRGMTIGLFDP